MVEDESVNGTKGEEKSNGDKNQGKGDRPLMSLKKTSEPLFNTAENKVLRKLRYIVNLPSAIYTLI